MELRNIRKKPKKVDKRHDVYAKEYNHNRVFNGVRKSKRTILQANMGLITEYFQKQDGKTKSTAYIIKDEEPFSLTEDIRSAEVVKTYTDKMKNIVTTKQALERIVGFNKPQGETSEFYKNYIFSDTFQDDEEVYNLSVSQQQLDEYQVQLTQINEELTAHIMVDISEEVEQFFEKKDIRVELTHERVESIYRGASGQNATSINKTMKTRNIKGCGYMEIYKMPVKSFTLIRDNLYISIRT